MAERAAFIVLATGREDGGPVHCRGWRIDPAAVEELAAAMNGEPLEWIWDDADSPGGVSVLLGGTG
jgi:hypothetical protein